MSLLAWAATWEKEVSPENSNYGLIRTLVGDLNLHFLPCPGMSKLKSEHTAWSNTSDNSRQLREVTVSPLNLG